MKTITSLVFIFFITFFSIANATEEQPVTVELYHFWVSPGEKAAVDEIRKAIEKRGAHFKDVSFKNAVALNSHAIERITLGYPPSMIQWIYGGRDAQALMAMGAIRKLPIYWREQPLQDILFPNVFKETSHQDKISSIPMGIHLQNMAFYNADIYQSLNLELPESWSDFIKQAPLIQKAGYTPIALSDEWWQLRILFQSILLEQLGSENFLEFRKEKHPVTPWKKQLVQSLKILDQLRSFAGESYQNRLWSDASKMVIEGKAAMQVMGDWAKGELTAAGLVADKDYFCSLSPGAEGTQIYATDNFAMLNIKDEHLLKGQHLLFDTVLTPEVQAAFNRNKGGIPVRYGVPLELLDSCASKYYQQWIKNNPKQTFIPEDLGARSTFIGKTISDSWKADKDIDYITEQVINFTQQQAKRAGTQRD